MIGASDTLGLVTDGFWWQLLVALAYATLGSVIPVLNSEAFIVASLATGLIDPWSLGLGLGVGQGAGKMILFLAVRQGRRLPWLRSSAGIARPTPEPGTLRARWRALVRRLDAVVEHPRWGPLGLFMSGSVSLPPNYATTLLAATTRIRFPVFAASMSLGLIARSLVISLALAGVFDHWF
ncbi:hypothetical protein GCM10009785_32390 [Brooklawnia cerclae]